VPPSDYGWALTWAPLFWISQLSTPRETGVWWQQFSPKTAKLNVKCHELSLNGRHDDDDDDDETNSHLISSIYVYNTQARGF